MCLKEMNTINKNLKQKIDVGQCQIWVPSPHTSQAVMNEPAGSVTAPIN